MDKPSPEENPMADYVCHQCGEATLIEVGATWACLNCGEVL